MIHDLISNVKDFKTERQNTTTNYQEDTVFFFRQMRLRLARKYATSDFGPVHVSRGEEMVGMSEADMREYVTSQEDATQLGYDRVRDKIREMKDIYRSCAGSQGPGKMGDWDPVLLRNIREIWGNGETISISKEVGGDDNGCDDGVGNGVGSLTESQQKQAKRNIGTRILNRLEYFWDHGFLGII